MAAVQSVRFTEEQARAVARLLNEMESNMKAPDMKTRDGIEAQCGLNDVWPGDEYRRRGVRLLR